MLFRLLPFISNSHNQPRHGTRTLSHWAVEMRLTKPSIDWLIGAKASVCRPSWNPFFPPLTSFLEFAVPQVQQPGGCIRWLPDALARSTFNREFQCNDQRRRHRLRSFSGCVLNWRSSTFAVTNLPDMTHLMAIAQPPSGRVLATCFPIPISVLFLPRQKKG